MALVLNGSNNTVAGLAVGGLPDGSTDADALASNAVTNVKVADDAIGVAELSATGTASSSTYLRGDNSWATVSAGAGGATALSLNDGVKVNFGADDDLRIYGGTGNSYIQHQDTAAGDLFIDAQNSNIYLRSGDGSTGEENAIVCENNGKVKLYHSGTTVAETNAHGLQCYYSHGVLQFRAGSDNSDDVYIKDGSLNFDSNNNGNSLGWIALYGHEGGTTQFRDVKVGHGKGGGYCTFDGSAETITGDFNDTSDERLKKDIVSIGDEGLTKIKQLRPVSFKWRNTDRNSYGFIAQEVETILPHAVETTITDDADFAIEDANAKARGAVAVKDLKALNTNSLVAYLVKAVQELSVKVAALEAG